MAAGDFTASSLPQYKYAIEKVIKNSLAKQKKEEEAAFLKAMIAQDKSTVSKLMEDRNNQCQGIKIYWLKEFNATASMTTPTNWVDPLCDFTGTLNESTEYSMSGIKTFKSSFSVEDRACPNLIEKAEEIAEGQRACLQAIRKELNAFSLSKFTANLGVQKYTEADYVNLGTTANAGLLTKLHPGNLNHIDFIPYWESLKAWNRFNNLHVVDGSCFAKVMSTNMILDGTQKEDQNQLMMNNMFDAYYRDPKFFATNTLTNSFFAINDGSLAAVFHNNFSEAAKPYDVNGGKKQLHYSIPLGLLDQKGNSIMVDVQYKEESVTNADTETCHLIHTWSYRVYHNVYPNPNLGDGRTGVLKFSLDGTLTKKANPFFASFA